MNLRKVIVLVIITAMPFLCVAQVRNLPGMNSFGIGFGIGLDGYAGSAVYERILVPNLSLKTELMAQLASYKGIRFNTYNIFGGLSYSFWNINEFMYLKIGLGGTASYNHIVDYSLLNNDGKGNGINYGVYVEPEIDIFLFNGFILFVNAKQVFQFNEILGNWYWVASTGFKYQF